MDDLVSWDKYYKFFQVFLEDVGYCIRDKAFFQLSLCLAYWNYDISSDLTAADKTQILR